MMLALCTQVTFCRWINTLHDAGGNGKLAHLASVLEGKVKCETRDTLGLGTGGDFEVFHDTGVGLVLESRVFTLGVLSDDSKVDVVVAGGEAGEGLAENDGGVDVELLTHGDIP